MENERARASVGARATLSGSGIGGVAAVYKYVIPSGSV